MNRTRVLVMAAGGMGTALATALAKGRLEVRLWDMDEDWVRKAKGAGCNDRYPYLAQHPFPSNLDLFHSPQVSVDDFDYVIVASSMAGVRSTLDALQLTNPSPTIVTIQKGMTTEGKLPYELVKERFPGAHAISMTGAGFAQDLLRGDDVGMIVSYREGDRRYAGRFASDILRPTRIWPAFTDKLAGVCFCNVSRTAISLMQGIVRGYNKPNAGAFSSSTLAFIYERMEAEGRKLASWLGYGLPDSRTRAASIIEADKSLCRDEGSRNNRFGALIGGGISFQDAVHSIEGTVEGTQNLVSIVAMIKRRWEELSLPGDWGERFPFIALTSLILSGKLPVGVAVGSIVERRQSWLSRRGGSEDRGLALDL